MMQMMPEGRGGARSGAGGRHPTGSTTDEELEVTDGEEEEEADAA